MRCVACNRQLSGTEMSKKKLDGSYEDMCNTCKRLARETRWDNEKVCANITELPFVSNGLTAATRCDY